jgi:putative chitinase
MNHLQIYQAANKLKPDGIIGPRTADVMMQDLGIKSAVNFAHFIGQLQLESGNFTAGRENLNYSAEGILKTFNTRTIIRFSKLDAQRMARKPREIANRAYANRMGNGDELSGDGWRYRGSGPTQITGKTSTQNYFKSVGLPIWTDPNVICQPEHYFRSAVWFWDENNVWQYSEQATEQAIIHTSKKINLGNANHRARPHGLEERIAFTEQMFITMGLT